MPVFNALQGKGELVEFLTSFSRHYGAHVTLGQEFLSAVIDTQLHPTLLLPFTRVGLLATNMSAPPEKVVDQVARLLTKSDIEKLKALKMRQQLQDLELFLSRMWNLAKASSHGKDHFHKCFGKCAIRAVLKALGKLKQGFEKKEYDWNEIEAKLVEELAASHVGPSSSKQVPAPMVGLDDAEKPMFQLKDSLKLKVGMVMAHKDFVDKVWECMEVTDAGLKLQSKSLLDPSLVMAINVSPDEIKTKLKILKDNKLPKLLPTSVFESLFPDVQCSLEIEKASIFGILIKAWNENDCDADMLLYQEQPVKQIFANKNIKAKGLSFIPVTDRVASITDKKPASGHFGIVKKGDATFYILPPKPWKEIEDEKGVRYTGVLAPFWTCSKGDDAGVMQKAWLKVEDYQIEILQNPAPLLKHDLLEIKDVKIPDAKAKASSKKRKIT